MKYKVVAVFWQDHVHVTSSPLKGIEASELLRPTLSVGIVVKETEEVLIVASDIERYEDRDDMTYTIIFRNAITAIKEYGIIEIKRLKIE